MAGKLHDELCQKAARFLMNNGFSVAFDDRFKAATSSGENPDALGFRNGVSCLIEVKVSRADFLADKNKRVRKDGIGMGDWRFYLAPKGLIKMSDLPKGWGLLESNNRRISKTIGWPPNTQWHSQAPFTGNKQNEVDYLYSALRRLKIAGHLNDVYPVK
tara:strand:+ start:1078 stop:1554 length:477 start_codon:yes stop_codon:yes gene_type:complete